MPGIEDFLRPDRLSQSRTCEQRRHRREVEGSHPGSGILKEGSGERDKNPDMEGELQKQRGLREVLGAEREG